MPIRRDLRETQLPRVRAGTLRVPRRQNTGLTRVIVTLDAPPLAAWQAQRTLDTAASTQHRLDVRTVASRRYLARLATLQRAAATQVRTAIPGARIQEHFGVLLDGFALQLPWRALPELERLPSVHRVYPSLAYYSTMDRGPSVIHADELQAATGDAGQGMKIAVVDTGVDPTNPFLSPAGFSYPAGFPRGDTRLTTPKVIVARVFPGAVRDARSNKAFDPTEPHGTHVAGIAAGDSGTDAPAGVDHPAVANLSGVAPKAWIGNYRVFTVPTPLGHEGDTPEIIEAFEAAVADGMNVINFSGGGPQTDPANDALVEAVHNVAAAGVVPVIAAGNDRDDFGLGSASSPGTAPEAISVAAVSNAHVFAPELIVAGAPPSLAAVPIQGAGGARFPISWSAGTHTLVDAANVLGADGRPVDRYLCGDPTAPNTTLGTIAKGSLSGKIVLAYRGICSFVSKAARALYAGAAGLILIDNRFGEANPIPIPLPLPAGMISDLDGAHLRAFIAANGGAASVRVTSAIEEIPAGRSGIVTSFSSAGPTDFGLALKPDISAPGLDVLSSTPQASGAPFAVYAGTSMATPHVAGAAALLLQRHPQWTPWNVKSALMSTAGPAWGNTARTVEASVLLEGAGLTNVLAADQPRIFTDPQSLSFGGIDVTHGGQHPSQLLTVTDAGGGTGDWSVTLEAQAQTNGVQIDLPPQISLAPGGDTALPVSVRASADAVAGENTGFVILSQGTVQRRVPYAFLVERPALEPLPAPPVKALQTGSTRGTSLVSQYCCPSQPFGPPPNYTGPPMNEDGAEHLYSFEIDQPVVNFGVSVLAESRGALVDPFVLGSKNENDVQGYSGTPTDINALTFDYLQDVGAAGVQFPALKRYYVAVDSQANEVTNQPQQGTYLLHAWVNDVVPPAVRMLTTRVSAGRPLLVGRAIDLGAGVDPLSLVFNYHGVLLGASAFDPVSGLVAFSMPPTAPPLDPGVMHAVFFASDFQEAKNVNSVGNEIYPNSTFHRTTLTVVDGPAVTWLAPGSHSCASRHETLTVTASSTARVVGVVFKDGRRTIGARTGNQVGLYAVPWNTSRAKRGGHHLTVIVIDASGRSAKAALRLNVCR
jgi:subtilisin family serine protease